MPKIDGIELINRVRKEIKHPPLILMVTALATEASKAHAMDSGADVFIPKPFDIDVLLNELKSGLNIKLQSDKVVARKIEVASPKILPNHYGVGIAASTGSPPVVIDFFKKLNKDLNCAYFLVQHSPEWMLETFTMRINQETGFNAFLAKEDLRIRPGNIYVAPDDKHMVIKNSSLLLGLNQDAKENFVRPAADTTFRTIAQYYGKNSIGIVMTGLGKDGTNGMVEIDKLGGRIMV